MPELHQADDLEDIFDEVDGEVKEGGPSLVRKPGELPKPVVPQKMILEEGGKGVSGSRLFVKIIIIIIALLLLAVVAYTIWQHFVSPAGESVTNTNLNNLNIANENINSTNAANQNQNTNSQALIDLNVTKLDSDRDGLLDQEEKELGTSPNSPDTDIDGLYDYEEVKVYLTDPLDSDTDNDGYLDGAEVKNGFDPKGTGKLYNLNQALKNING